ncbi:MAG: hypothetical protein ACRDPW_09760, partial [Mycobacteriales bacterium]
MTDTASSTPDRRARLMRSVASYEAEKSAADQAVAGEREAGEPAGTVNFSVRLPVDLAVQMRTVAGQQQLPTSVWLRRAIAAALR